VVKKKTLLFVTLYLHTGGVEKSLISLLTALDYTKYEVDLLLFDHSGVLFKSVPEQVNILPPLFETYSTPLKVALPQLIKNGKGHLLLGKCLAPLAAAFSKGVGTGLRWAVYRKVLSSPEKKYDVAISYLDFFSNYYVVEKVRANRKILYNHMDYSSDVGWQTPQLDRKTFENSDYVVTVADTSKRSLVDAFPELADKVRVIHNSVSPSLIKSLSLQFNPLPPFQGINIVTVARLVKEKGVYLALEACKQLVDQGHLVRWTVVGGGRLYEELRVQVEILGLEEAFVLVGEKENPYPYMANCDIYVQPSLTEAHCVAVEEALALCKPIVVTDIDSFREQIIHQEMGLLVEPSSIGLALGIKRMIEDSGLRKAFTQHLEQAEGRNQSELEKFYQLIEA
jgi:glycosyltransferase involved in cell wall biosynthesis